MKATTIPSHVTVSTFQFISISISIWFFFSLCHSMSPPVSPKRFSFTWDCRQPPLSQLSYPYTLPQSAPKPNDTIQQLPLGLAQHTAVSHFTFAKMLFPVLLSRNYSLGRWVLNGCPEIQWLLLRRVHPQVTVLHSSNSSKPGRLLLIKREIWLLL